MSTMTSSKTTPRLLSALRRLWHPHLLYLVVCLVVWLPDGFNIGPANDGWRDLGPAPYQWHLAFRFFGQLPKVVGLHLVRGGFQGWELMLFIVTVLRAVVVFEIFRRLFPRYLSFAVACGLLALFHPADHVYFWMDSVGLDFDYLVALTICLAAVVYLQTQSRESLLSLLFLQVVLCFSYTAYLPFVFGFCIGVWILRRMEGYRDKPSYFLATTVPTLLSVAFQALVALRGLDREGHILDMHLRVILKGCVHEMGLFVHGFNLLFDSIATVHWWAVLAVVPGMLAYLLGKHWHGPSSEAEKPIPPRHFYLVLVFGFLTLAVLGYLPYAVSKVRIGAERQLLVAGFFIYVIALMPIFFWLLPRLASRKIESAVLALLALTITVNGLENRAYWVRNYRLKEEFLSALATAVPNPAPGTTIIVHLHNAQQEWELSGLQHLEVNFRQALRYMYGDGSLSGAFLSGGAHPVHIEGSQAQIDIMNLNMKLQQLKPDLGRLLFIDYSPDHELTVLDQQWLRQNTPPGSDVSAYQPAKTYDASPSRTSVVCTMMEKGFRPAYCR